MTKVVTLIPLRIGGSQERQWLWDQTKPYLEELGYPIYIGEPNGEAWNRSQSINNAARAAGDWEVALIGDGDTIPDEVSVKRAVSWVEIGGGAARPHLERVMLNAIGSQILLRRGHHALSNSHLDKQWAGGGLLVVRRDAWDAIGGYDENFIGWGHEDSDFNIRMLATVNWERLPGVSWHLWHDRVKPATNAYNVNTYNQTLRKHLTKVDWWGHQRGLPLEYARRLL